MTGRPLKPALYVLPHGIEVVGTYPAKGVNRYARVRIRPHPFFPKAKVVHGGCDVRLSRVLLAAKLGRALTAQEHAHHGDENPLNDAPGNLELLTAAEHNRHHKTGVRHSTSTKEQIRRAVKRAYAEGRHQRFVITKRDPNGRISP